MKIRKCTKRICIAVCVICMISRPLSLMAAVADLSETEGMFDKIPIEETVEDTLKEPAEIDEIVEVIETAEAEDASAENHSYTENEQINGIKTPVELLKGTGEVDISDYSGVIMIDGSNLTEYDYKTITGTAPVGASLVIAGGVTVHLTMKDLTIDRAQEGSVSGFDAIALNDNSTLYLTIEGSNVLRGHDSFGGCGIRVEEGNTLIITEESSGSLMAAGGNGMGGAAGIGAGNCGYAIMEGTVRRSPALGTIEIHGGTIEARGGVTREMGQIAMGSAGIGGSAMGEPGSGSIIISGGNVTASGISEGAGIGGGTNGYVGSIVIIGGVVTANAGDKAAAIGSGCKGNLSDDKLSCGSISITGGRVIANGNIGYGHHIFDKEDMFEGGSVTIDGTAVVTVNNGEINPKEGVVSGHVTQKYAISVRIENPAYTEGTKTGHITIGTGENAFSEDITFDLAEGKAISAFTAETVLFGEQPVNVSIDGAALENKTILLGTETDIVYSSEAQDLSVSDVSEGVTYRYNNGVILISGSGTASISMTAGVTSTTDSVIVGDGSDVTLTLEDLNIDTTGKGRSPVRIGQNGAAVCKLIPEGINTLKRSDSGLAVGVIDANDGSTLKIGGTGTISMIGGRGAKSWPPKCEDLAGGIRALNASVIIEDCPVLDISNGRDGEYFSGILSKNITINGGIITAKPGVYGQGIGMAYDYSNCYDVKINGGTVYAEGGKLSKVLGGISNDNYARPVISGGSINMNDLGGTDKPDAFNDAQPVNSTGTRLYCTTISVGYNSTKARNVRVTGLTVKNNGGRDYAYGTDHMYTDGDGKLYLWLPEGSIVSEVITEIGRYVGECVTNNTTSNKAGNYFGTASATFELKHAFTKEEKSADALMTAGTCKDKAVYYYSCEYCGTVEKNDSHTFEGDLNPEKHVGGTEVRNASEAVHAAQTDGYTGDICCLGCDQVLSAGSAITVTPHEPSGWKHDNAEHWKECTVQGCGMEITGSRGVHSSTGENAATCQKKAVCDECGAEYGEKTSCSFTVEIKSEAALKTPGTCKDKAVYYYSCEYCGTVEKNDSHTFEGDKDPDNHAGDTEVRNAKEAVHVTQTNGYTGDIYCLGCNMIKSKGSVITVTPHESSEWMHDESKHWKKCSVEGCGMDIPESIGAHSSTGDKKATCQKKALCDECDIEYGEKTSCSFTAKIMSEAALKTPATAAQGAVYYYSCSMCGKVEKNDAHTFADSRKPESKPLPEEKDAEVKDGTGSKISQPENGNEKSSDDDDEQEPLFTGTWNNPVKSGSWSKDKHGVWHYTSSQQFRNTWAYIFNAYAHDGQNQYDWFWFDIHGNMLTGWQFINGKWYYLNPAKDGTLGACLTGIAVTPDGWTVDENGAWIESIPKK